MKMFKEGDDITVSVRVKRVDRVYGDVCVLVSLNTLCLFLVAETAQGYILEGFLWAELRPDQLRKRS
jgi:hypothetical protein